MRVTIVFAMMVVGCAVTAPATAQNIPDAQRMLHALSPAVDKLVTATTNLSQMEETVQHGTPEFNFADHVVSLSFEYQGAMSEARAISKILVNMTCPADAQFVRGELGQSVQFAMQAADNDIKAINAFLTRLTTPAIVSEATKIRDLVIKIRDILKPFTGKEP